MAKKTFSGGVPATQLSGSLSSSATSFTVSSATGYPTGSAGPFVVCIDRGTASEEKILISSVASTTFTVASGGRGYDGTTAKTHSSAASVEHVLDADTISEANDHVNTTSRDDHTQYLNNARHDVTARHAFGGALGTPAAPAAVGTTAAAGTGSVPSRSDHVHVLGTDSVTTAAIASGAVTTAKLAAGAVDATALGTDAVTTAKIATDAVTSAKIAADAVGSSEIATGAVGSAEIAANAVIAGKLADGAVDTTARLADAIVSRPKMAAGFTGITVGAAPSSPVSGETYYNTTSNELLTYTTVTTGWAGPWNLAWGAQAVATTTTNQAGIGATATDLTSLTGSLAATWPANRRVKIRVFLPGCAGTVANDAFELRIQEGTTVLQANRLSINSTVQYVPATAEIVVTPSAGAHTYKAVMIRTVGTGTIDNGAASAPTATAVFTIEDLGPAGAPA
jgi:hypothetical protein